MWHNMLKTSENQQTIIKPTEILGLILLLVLFLLINLFTGSRTPTVWMDEVMFTDPAVNLYLGKGFVSSAWSVQPMHEFWAGNVPLYPLLLHLWMKIFGFDILTVRSFNYLLMCIASLGIWGSVIRLNLITSPLQRFTLISFFLFNYGIAFNYRTGRSDCLGILLFTFAALVFSIKKSWLRYTLVFSIGLLCPSAGLQLAVLGAVFCFLLIIFLGRQFFLTFILFAIGLTSGIFALFFLYYSQGVLSQFFASVRVYSHASTSRNFIDILVYKLNHFWIGFGGLRDPGFLVLIVIAMILATYRLSRHRFKLISVLSFGIASGFSIPISLGILGVYPIYYSWMASIPLAVCICSELSDLQLSQRYKSKIILFYQVILMSVLFMGLPMQLGIAFTAWNARDYSLVAALASQNINQDDTVYSDFGAYYAVKKIARTTILPPYLSAASQLEKESISILIIDPQDFVRVSKEIGGTWLNSGNGLGSQNKNGKFSKQGVFSKLYALEVYRRSK